MAASEFDADFLQAHLSDERRKSALLGEIREAIFGAQDGLISTVAVVNFVAGASQDNYYVIVAGLATALGGIFSMAAGEYISSKSQREIFDAQIVDEREEVHERPGEAEAEVAYMFTEDGLPPDKARRGGAHHGRPPRRDAQDDGREGAQPGGRGAARVAAPGRPRHGCRLRPRLHRADPPAPVPHRRGGGGRVGRADARRPVRDRRGEEPLDASVLVDVRAGDPGDRRDRRRGRLLLRHRPAGSSSAPRRSRPRSPRRPSRAPGRRPRRRTTRRR